MTMLVCEQCKAEGKETKIPYDEIGVALMRSHLREHDPRTADGLPGGTYTGNEDYDPTERWL